MRGVFTALITPFKKDGSIDMKAFEALVDDQESARVDGIVPCGTTGETPALTLDEKKSLIQYCADRFKGRKGLRVIAGTGTNDTRETIRFSKWAEEAGVDGILVVTPYYNKPSQAGLEAHFLAVADSVDTELILYNVPGRTGVSLTAETIAKLAAHPKIRTVKEATGNVAFTSEIVDACARRGTRIDILSGDDATYLPLMAVGATGVISVASNLFPRAMREIQSAMEKGQLQAALEIHNRYYPLFRDLFVESNPVPIKHALSVAGFCEPHVRMPLAPLTSASLETLEKSLARCGIQKGSRL